MFQGYSDATSDFLWGVRFNNDRAWFQEHKEDYLAHLQRPTSELAREVYDAFMEKFPKERVNLHIARIYRDARRLQGKGPYKDYLWFSLRVEHGFESCHPELWFDINPEGWSCGLGFWAATPAMMAAMRRDMDENPARLTKLAKALKKQDVYHLEGPDYKRPKGTGKGVLDEWYNKKSVSISRTEPFNDLLCSAELKDAIVEGFTFLKPFYDYFESFVDGGLEDLK